METTGPGDDESTTNIAYIISETNTGPELAAVVMNLLRHINLPAFANRTIRCPRLVAPQASGPVSKGRATSLSVVNGFGPGGTKCL
jgi:hypothetical protein